MAVTAFLRGCVDGIKACLDKLPLCEGVDFPMTCYNTLTSILKKGYNLIISKHSTTLTYLADTFPPFLQFKAWERG